MKTTKTTPKMQDFLSLSFFTTKIRKASLYLFKVSVYFHIQNWNFIITCVVCLLHKRFIIYSYYT